MASAAFDKLGRDPIRVLNAGRELLDVEAGEEPYLADLQAAMTVAVESCEAAIDAATELAVANQQAAGARREVAVFLEDLLSDFRAALAAHLGETSPVVRGLRAPARGRAEDEPTPSESSVSLVSETEAAVESESEAA